MDEKIKLFFVANSEYKYLGKLDGVVNSTKRLYEFFSTKICKESNIKYLVNQNKDIIIQELTSFIKTIQPEDIFIFYFCGHGFLVPPDYKNFLMATYETSEDTLSFENGISFHSLESNLRQYSIKKSIIIIDSCYSGQALKCMGDDTIIIENCPEGTVLITSTTSKSSSYTIEIDGTEQAGFSYYFWKALSDTAESSVSRSIKDIFSNTKKLLSENAILKSMKPQIKCENELADYRFITIDQHLNKPSFPLEVIDWRITSQCDNKCQFCYASNTCKNLSINEIDKIISEINRINFNAICITGGEPTLNDNLVTIIEKLYESNHSIYLSTNGSKYLERKDDIENYLDKLSLPLDGYDSISNSINGRNLESFETVKRILDYYSKDNTYRKFNIKISTLLTKKNCTTDHFDKMYQFLKEYPIDIWKIYEFIPESRGSSKSSRRKYELTNEEKLKIKDKVNSFSLESKFKIELVERKDRNAAYFIIQPNGVVMIPTEDESNDIVNEVKIGNLLKETRSGILAEWYDKVIYENYINNIRVRDFKRSIILTEIQKNVLKKIVSSTSLPSITNITKELEVQNDEVEKAFVDLYNLRVIKNTIPIINLELFNLKRFLVTLKIKNNGKLSKRHIAEILCYNNHFGWVSEISDGNFRVAIFANDLTKVEDIVENEVKCYLQNDLVDYETQTLEVAYAFGEANLLNNSESEKSSFNYFEKKQSQEVFITIDEYNLLEKFKTLNQLTEENVNDLYYESKNEVLPIINSLIDKHVIEKLHAIIDTKLIGYKWYLVFVKNVSHMQKLNKREFSEYLYNSFDSLTHINCFEDRGNSTEYIMDFEIHVKSNFDVENIIRKIGNKYNNLKFKYKQILQEHKFEFTTNTVLETIFENYIEEKHE